MVRKRRKSRKKRNTWRYASFVIIAVAIIMIIVAVFYQGPDPKFSVEEYFKITDLSSGSFRFEKNGTGIFLSELTFNITAVGGDAHTVYANTARLAGADAVYLEDMMRNESRFTTLYFIHELYLSLKEEGWGPIRIQISARETEIGSISVYLPGPEF